MNLDELREWISEFNDHALLADGFDAAIIGVAERCSQPTLIVYDAEKCIEILVQRDGIVTRTRASFSNLTRSAPGSARIPRCFSGVAQANKRTSDTHFAPYSSA